MNTLTKYFVALSFLASAVSACSEDSTEKNPHFNAGSGGSKTSAGGGSPSAGARNATGGAGGKGGATGIDHDGGRDATATPESDGGGGDDGGGAPGAGGAATDSGPPTPPYDCVLNPKTHLEIINACTDAVRIEKHPGLPALPGH
jgi:hypothetical protein